METSDQCRRFYPAIILPEASRCRPDFVLCTICNTYIFQLLALIIDAIVYRMYIHIVYIYKVLPKPDHGADKDRTKLTAGFDPSPETSGRP